MDRKVLEGLRIADFSWAWAGPYGILLLSMLGAEVVKVETNKRPDHSRIRSLMAGKFAVARDDYNGSPIFADLNYNKLSISLDLGNPDAVTIAKRLISVSDVVIENFRPGVMEKLGLGYAVVREVKPDIIMLSSSALGSDGPESRYAGYAPTFAALSGLTYITGYPDGQPVSLMGSIDLRSATTSAFAILAALNHRATTGEGQYVDLSSRDSVVALLGDVFMDYTMNRRVPTRRGNENGTAAPHNCYRCRGEDRWISIAVFTDEEWDAFCEALGHPDWTKDPKFADGFLRWHNRQELDRQITAWTSQRSPLEAMETLQNAGVAAVPSFTGEDLYKSPHLQERQYYVTLEHPVVGRRITLGPPWKLSTTPPGVYRHAPLLGQHNEEVLHGLLGLSLDEIERLSQSGALT